MIVTSTAGAYGALGPFITGLRTLGNNTPIINSWAGDGNYWLPKSPPVTNYYFVTFASVFGDDPNPAVNKLAKQVNAGTGGFITGSAAIDGLVTAIRRSGGSTNGATLAATMEKFRGVPTLSGKISFSAKLHTVFGRQYRVIKIQNNKPRVVGRGRREGRREDLSVGVGSARVGEEARRDPPGLLCLTLLRGRAGVARCQPHARPRRGGRPDRPERRRQVDARERPQRLRPPRRGNRRTCGAGRHALVAAPARPQGARAHVPAQPRVPRPVGARERGGVGARCRRRPARSCASGRALCSQRLGLDGYADAPASALAHGDERRLGVARALATEPSFVLLDEPAAGLTEAEVPDFAALVRSIASEHGAGVLLIDHNMALIMETCERIQVLDQGTVLAEGAPAEIRANLDVAAAYLGDTPGARMTLVVDGPRRSLRRRARGPRPVVHRRARRDRRPDRPERRGEVVDAARDHGSRTGVGQRARSATASCSAAGPRTSRAAASRSSRRDGASTPS